MNIAVYAGVLLLLRQCYCGQIYGVEGDCTVEGFDQQEWDTQKVFLDHIKDIDIRHQIFIGTYSNIQGVGDCTTQNCYFSVYLNDSAKQLQIVANENLAKIDGDYKTGGPSREISTIITLNCNQGTRDLKFQVTIDDTNNHYPQFSNKDGYEYTLPMPIPPGINLMQFGQVAIAANDIDFSNTNIIYTSDLPGLTHTTKYVETESYPYVLSLEFNKITRLLDTTTFTITATDNGNPTKSSTAKVTFKIDEKNSEPYTPVFTKPSFLYKYDPDTVSISPEDGELITLDKSPSGKIIKCEVMGSLQEYFNDPLTNTDNTINVSLKTKLPDVTKSVVKITLACYVTTTIDAKSYANVIISIPPDITVTAQFSKTTFMAKYLIDQTGERVEMVDTIALKEYKDGVSIKVEDAYNSFFEVKSAGEKNQWILSKTTNLNTNVLQNSSINIIISLTLEGRLLDKASVKLLLPNGETGVSFALPLFSGKYVFDKNGNGKLTIDSDIALNSQYVKASNPVLTGDYSGNFKVEVKSDNSFEVTKIQDLPEKVLELGVLTLTLRTDLIIGAVSQPAETAIILYISSDASTSTSTSTTSSEATPTTSQPSSTTNKPDDNCDSNTIWIIIICLLCLVLVLYVGGTIFYYLKNIRKRHDNVEFPVVEQKIELPFDKRRQQHDNFSAVKDISKRRPTGFIRFNPEVDNDPINEELNNNTTANKFVEVPDEEVKKQPGSGKNVEFSAPSLEPEGEVLTLADELKKAVQERENRLI